MELQADVGITMDQAAELLDGGDTAVEAPAPREAAAPQEAERTIEDRITASQAPAEPSAPQAAAPAPEAEPRAINTQLLRMQLAQAAGHIESQFQTVDWDQLRASDPARWTALREQYAGYQQQFKDEAARLDQHDRAVAEHQQASTVTAHGQHMAGQVQRMLDLVPEWKNEKVRIDETNAIVEMLRESGYHQSEIDGLSEARLIPILRKAAGLDRKTVTRQSRNPDDDIERVAAKSGMSKHGMDFAALKIARLM